MIRSAFSSIIINKLPFPFVNLHTKIHGERQLFYCGAPLGTEVAKRVIDLRPNGKSWSAWDGWKVLTSDAVLRCWVVGRTW
jgi:hypothetical protein